ncbi:MAG TPA: polysaccharide deacetylase family protein [Bauldia sp.]|nr:polysaccharide deacetylase family protein [Bauldia sp.]
MGYGETPPKVVWPNGAKVAISLVINVEEGAERSPLYGDDRGEPGGEGYAVPPGFRDLRGESAFEYGTRAGFWRLLEILRRQNVHASFFISAAALEKTPEIGRALVAEGHEPVCHGYRWMPAYLLDRERERDDLRKAIAAIEQICGTRPLGYYSRGESPNTRSLVQEEGGFVYNSDTYADDLPFYVSEAGRPMLMVPYSLEINDTKFNRPVGMSEPRDLYRYLVATLDCLHREGAEYPKMMSLGIHQRLGGKPGRAAAINAFIEYAKTKGDVWFARRIDIARTWLRQFPPGQPP